MSHSARRYAGSRMSQRPRSRSLHEMDTRQLGTPARPLKVKTITSERRSKREMAITIAKARKDIIRVMRGLKHHILHAMNAKDAVGQLFLLIKHPKRVVDEAFSKMLGDNDVREIEYGYVLDPLAA